MYKKSGDLGVIYLALCCLFGLPVYSHLSNKRGGWNERGWGAKNAKS